MNIKIEIKPPVDVHDLSIVFFVEIFIEIPNGQHGDLLEMRQNFATKDLSHVYIWQIFWTPMKELSSNISFGQVNIVTKSKYMLKYRFVQLKYYSYVRSFWHFQAGLQKGH